MNEEKAIELLKKYELGTISPEEKARLETWYLRQGSESKNQLSHQELEESFYHLKKQLPVKFAKEKMLWPRIAVAASVVIVLGAGFWSYISRHPDAGQDPRHAMYANDITPGGNKAILTLASGKQILLTDASNGALAEQAGASIRKTKDGQLVYMLRDPSSLNTKYGTLNTVATPRGGTYKITLSDGTLVTLNAASTLKFPATFTSLKERKVELTGEAYFEVKHNAKLPFRVQTKSQTVEDIGTAFNINSYTDETTTKTTLIEGSARIISNHLASAPRHSELVSEPRNGKSIMSDNAVVLKPGQQSSINPAGNIEILQVNAEEVAGWKNGDFVFDGEDLRSAMRKIARWYDIEVIYDPAADTHLILDGLVSRKSNISEVLKWIETISKVHFKIEGRRVTVTK